MFILAITIKIQWLSCGRCADDTVLVFLKWLLIKVSLRIGCQQELDFHSRGVAEWLIHKV